MLLSAGEEVIANMSTTSTPDFFITNLDPAQDYSATVYSFNSKGWSKIITPVIFRTQLAPGLKEQRRSTGPTDSDKNGAGPWLYILLAAGSTLIIAGAVGAIVFAIRRFRVGTKTCIKYYINNLT